MPLTAKNVRRIVAGDDGNGKAVVLSDDDATDVRTDPARPGFYATRLWVTESTPAKTKGIQDSTHLPHTIEPPAGGSLFRFYEYPPATDDGTEISEADVRRYFEMMGSPDASVYSPDAPDPYMQKTESLDYVHIFEGEITLLLETTEVDLREGDTVIQRGTAHAWRNRSDAPCILVVSSHDGHYGAPLPKLPIRPDQSVANSPAPRRRVVTGHDAEGRSCVTHDGDTPNVYRRPGGPSPYFSEFWTIETKPACLSGERDEGGSDRMVSHSSPALGANFRIVDAPSSMAMPGGQEKAELSPHEQFEAMNTNGLSEYNQDGPGMNFHRTPTVDYALNLGCDRVLVLDDSETVMHRGDVVIQLGTWHTWLNRTGEKGIMAFDMIGGEFSAS